MSGAGVKCWCWDAEELGKGEYHACGRLELAIRSDALPSPKRDEVYSAVAVTKMTAQMQRYMPARIRRRMSSPRSR